MTQAAKQTPKQATRKAMKILKSKPAMAAIALCLVIAGGAGGAVLFQKFMGFRDDPSQEAKVIKSSKAFNYVELDKIMVSLPTTAAQEGLAPPPHRICSLNMAFEIERKNKDKFRDVTPLIRSIAVQALSTHSYSEIRSMPLEQLQNDVSANMLKIAASRHLDRPFNSAIVTQLLCE
jgi:flagellar FliL protein